MPKTIKTEWDEPDIQETGEYLHHDSTQFYDDIENPELSPRDKKNMRILDNTRVN